MSKQCGPNNITHCVDAKHLLKRLRGVCIHPTRGCRVSDGPPLTGGDVERLFLVAEGNGVKFDMPLKVWIRYLFINAVM